MKVHIITDTHFGHEKLTEMGVRPPKFTEDILNKLGHLMPVDMLIHLGDFCIGNDAAWHEAFFKALPPGSMKKVLVRGNHDHKGNAWYLSHGWDFVCDSFRLKFNGKDIVFTHEPLWPSVGDLNIHGHLHDNDHRLMGDMLNYYDQKYHRKLAIENTRYKAVDLDYFIRLSTPKDLTKETLGV